MERDGRVVVRRTLPQPLQRSEEHTSELQSRLHLVCRPLPEKKIRLIEDRKLALCKPGVVLVNDARSVLRDEHALAQPLNDGRVAGAGVDVYATEPCPDSPLS